MLAEIGSPKNTNTNSRYNKQGSIRREYPNDSSFGEMAYMDPGGENPYGKGQKKSNQNQNYNIRSPMKYSVNKENSNLNTNERMDMTSQLNYSNIIITKFQVFLPIMIIGEKN